MAATDTWERGMPFTEQPLHTDGSRRAPKERRVILAAALVTLLALAGIIVILTNGSKFQKPQTIATSPPAPSPETSEDRAVAAAETRYRQFLRVRDEVGHRGYRSSAPFDTVAVPPERTVQEISFRKARGLHQVGNTVVVSLDLVSVDLTPAAGDYPAVVLQACIDVSGVDVLDGEGKSIVSPSRAPRSQSTVTMYEYAKGTKGAVAGGWYVFEATSKGKPC